MGWDAFPDLEWEPNGLTAVLSRTKTSGPGKKVTLLRIFVSAGAWIKRDLWLSVGFEIWQGVKYSMACQMSQALFKEVMVDYEDAASGQLTGGRCGHGMDGE